MQEKKKTEMKISRMGRTRESKRMEENEDRKDSACDLRREIGELSEDCFNDLCFIVGNIAVTN